MAEGAGGDERKVSMMAQAPSDPRFAPIEQSAQTIFLYSVAAFLNDFVEMTKSKRDLLSRSRYSFARRAPNFPDVIQVSVRDAPLRETVRNVLTDAGYEVIGSGALFTVSKKD